MRDLIDLIPERIRPLIRLLLIASAAIVAIVIGAAEWIMLIPQWIRMVIALALIAFMLVTLVIIGWAIAFAPGKRKEEKYGNGHNDGI